MQNAFLGIPAGVTSLKFLLDIHLSKPAQSNMENGKIIPFKLNLKSQPISSTSEGGKICNLMCESRGIICLV